MSSDDRSANPLQNVNLSPDKCVICDRKKDIPGFFCSSCSTQNTTVSPATTDLRRIQEMQPGETGYINPLAIFEIDGLYWIIGNFPIYPEPTGTHIIKLDRNIEGKFVFYIDHFDFDKIEKKVPENIQNLWFAKVYYYNINSTEDEDEEGQGSQLRSVGDLAIGEMGWVDPEAIFEADEVLWIVDCYLVSPERTNTETIPIYVDEDGDLTFETAHLNPDHVPSGWPRAFAQKYFKRIFYLDDDSE